MKLSSAFDLSAPYWNIKIKKTVHLARPDEFSHPASATLCGVLTRDRKGASKKSRRAELHQKMRVAAIFLFCLVPNIAVGFQAAPVTQLSDRAAWQHVTVGRTDVSFVGLGGNSGLDRWYPGGINVNGVTFTGAPYVGTTDYLYIRSDPNFLFGPPDGDLGCPQQIPCGNSGAGITVSLPKGVNSVGLDLASFWPAGPVNVVFRNNQTFTIGNPQTLQGSVFAGFTSPTPIDSFIIEAPGLPIVRDMSFGTHDVAASPLISVGGIVPVYGSTAV